MTEVSGPRWAVHSRRADATAETPDEILVLQCDSMITAIKRAQEKLAERKGEHWRIVLVEPAAPEPEAEPPAPEAA